MNKFIIIGVLCCCLTLSHSAPFAAELSVDDPTIVEGDIKLLPGTRSLGINDAKRLWPNGVVPYTIDADNFSVANLTAIKASMQMITDKTGLCITFVPKTDAHETWIRIFNGNGCYSYVGKVGKVNNFGYFDGRGPQDVSLGVGCIYKGTIVHELCHALGFKHEQNRPDRDEFVTINFQNVEESMKHNFDKYPEGDTFSTPYDYKSIMHYAETAFAINDEINTITPKEAGIDLIPSYEKTVAQVLSAFDIQAIRTRYTCSGTITYTNPPVTVTVSSCKNADRTCGYFNADQAATYCYETPSFHYTLNGVVFSEACSMLCGVCESSNAGPIRSFGVERRGPIRSFGVERSGTIEVALPKAGPIRRL